MGIFIQTQMYGLIQNTKYRTGHPIMYCLKIQLDKLREKIMQYANTEADLRRKAGHFCPPMFYLKRDLKNCDHLPYGEDG